MNATESTLHFIVVATDKRFTLKLTGREAQDLRQKLDMLFAEQGEEIPEDQSVLLVGNLSPQEPKGFLGFHIRDEGAPVRQGFNFWPWGNRHSRGFILRVGSRQLYFRYSKVRKRKGWSPWIVMIERCAG